MSKRSLPEATKRTQFRLEEVSCQSLVQTPFQLVGRLNISVARCNDDQAKRLQANSHLQSLRELNGGSRVIQGDHATSYQAMSMTSLVAWNLVASLRRASKSNCSLLIRNATGAIAAHVSLKWNLPGA
jgi:hypothetical protein